MPESVQINIELDYEEIYKSVLHKYAAQENRTILISHRGVFSQDLVNSLLDASEAILISSNEKKPLIRRIFSILLEGLQNIRIHGDLDEKNQKNGLVILAKDENSYRITFGNRVQKIRAEKMPEKLNQLNRLNEEELKSLYFKVLSNGIISNKSGAGLGFITMRMKSKLPLDFSFYAISEDNFIFVVEITVNRPNELFL
jgi:hypothetical protein